MPAAEAIRALVRGGVQGVGLRDATVRRARELMVTGWVRNGDAGTVQVHAEGDRRAVAELVEFLRHGPALADVGGVEIEPVAVEGHEQFAIRGVCAGVFVVQEHAATAHHFDLRLEPSAVSTSTRHLSSGAPFAARSRSASTTSGRKTRSKASAAAGAIATCLPCAPPGASSIS